MEYHNRPPDKGENPRNADLILSLRSMVSGALAGKNDFSVDPNLAFEASIRAELAELHAPKLCFWSAEMVETILRWIHNPQLRSSQDDFVKYMDIVQSQTTENHSPDDLPVEQRIAKMAAIADFPDSDNDFQPARLWLSAQLMRANLTCWLVNVSGRRNDQALVFVSHHCKFAWVLHLQPWCENTAKTRFCIEKQIAEDVESIYRCIHPMQHRPPSIYCQFCFCKELFDSAVPAQHTLAACHLLTLSFFRRCIRFMRRNRCEQLSRHVPRFFVDTRMYFVNKLRDARQKSAGNAEFNAANVSWPKSFWQCVLENSIGVPLTRDILAGIGSESHLIDVTYESKCTFRTSERTSDDAAIQSTQPSSSKSEMQTYFTRVFADRVTKYVSELSPNQSAGDVKFTNKSSSESLIRSAMIDFSCSQLMEKDDQIQARLLESEEVNLAMEVVNVHKSEKNPKTQIEQETVAENIGCSVSSDRSIVSDDSLDQGSSMQAKQIPVVSIMVNRESRGLKRHLDEWLDPKATLLWLHVANNKIKKIVAHQESVTGEKSCLLVNHYSKSTTESGSVPQVEQSSPLISRQLVPKSEPKQVPGKLQLPVVAKTTEESPEISVCAEGSAIVSGFVNQKKFCGGHVSLPSKPVRSGISSQVKSKSYIPSNRRKRKIQSFIAKADKHVRDNVNVDGKSINKEQQASSPSSSCSGYRTPKKLICPPRGEHISTGRTANRSYPSAPNTVNPANSGIKGQSMQIPHPSLKPNPIKCARLNNNRALEVPSTETSRSGAVHISKPLPTRTSSLLETRSRLLQNNFKQAKLITLEELPQSAPNIIHSSARRNHRRVMTRERKKYECLYCTTVLQPPRQKNHQENSRLRIIQHLCEHLGIVPYKCMAEGCSGEFSSPAMLERHAGILGNGFSNHPCYKCRDCPNGKYLKSAQTMLKHYQHEHEECGVNSVDGMLKRIGCYREQMELNPQSAVYLQFIRENRVS